MTAVRICAVKCFYIYCTKTNIYSRTMRILNHLLCSDLRCCKNRPKRYEKRVKSDFRKLSQRFNRFSPNH